MEIMFLLALKLKMFYADFKSELKLKFVVPIGHLDFEFFHLFYDS